MAPVGSKRTAKQKKRSGRIRILVADDHEVVRIGLKALLRLVEGFEVVGEASTKAETLAQVETLKPDLVLLDIRLPDGNGVDACREIRAAYPRTRVLFLSSYADDDMVLAALMSGAQGYLLKEVDRESLVESIRSVAAGHSLLHPEVRKRAIASLRLLANPESRPKTPRLSDQERRVLSLLSQGKTNKEIAAALRLSEKTVKNYLANAYDKLKVSRRSEAAVVFSRRHEET